MKENGSEWGTLKTGYQFKRLQSASGPSGVVDVVLGGINTS